MSNFNQSIDIEIPEDHTPLDEVASYPFGGGGQVIADDSSIKSFLSSIRASAELYRWDRDGFTGLCTTDNKSRRLIQDALDRSTGYSDSKPEDHCLTSADGDQWLVIGPLNDPELPGWCVDHSGIITEVDSSKPDPTVGYICEQYR